MAYIEQVIDHSQYRAVLCIVRSYPSLLPVLWSREGTDMTLVAFVVESLESSINDRVLCSRLIGEFGVLTSFADINSRLVVLRRCVEVVVNISADNVVISNGEKTCEMPLSKLVSYPTLYMFDLRIECLVPNSGDNVSLLTLKFETLSKKTEGTLVIFKIFDDFSKREYDEMSTACLRSIPNIINIFGKTVAFAGFRRFLKRIVNVEPKSWFHAVDIVNIIEAASVNYLGLIGGLECILKRLFGFSASRNNVLAKRAFDVIIKIVSEDNAELVCVFIINNMDVFDQECMVISTKLLTEIVVTFGKLPYVQAHVPEFLEMFWMQERSVRINNVMFEFLSKFDLYDVNSATMKRLGKIAMADVVAVARFYTGHQHVKGVSERYTDAAVERLDEYVASLDDTKIWFPHFRSTIELLQKLQDVESGFVNIVTDLLPVYPKAVTAYVMHAVPKLKANEVGELVLNAMSYLVFSPDLDVAVDWCWIFGKAQDGVSSVVRATVIHWFTQIRNYVFEQPEFASSLSLSVFGILNTAELGRTSELFACLQEDKKVDVVRMVALRERTMADRIFGSIYVENVLGEGAELSQELPTLTYTFTHVDRQIMQQETDDLDEYVVLAQVKGETCRFTYERIERLLTSSVERCDRGMALRVVEYVLRNDIQLSVFDNCDMSEMGLDQLIEYVKCGTSKAVIMNVIASKSTDAFIPFNRMSTLLHGDAEKKELIRVLKALPLNPKTDVESLLLLVRKWSWDPKDHFMRFVAALLSNMQDIPDNIISEILDASKESYDVDEIVPVISLISAVKPDADGIYDRLTDLIAVNHIRKSDHIKLLASASFMGMSMSRKRTLIGNTITSRYPSEVMSCYSFMEKLITKQHEKVNADMYQMHLAKMLDRANSFERNQPVMRSLASLVVTIFGIAGSKRIKDTVINVCDRFLPSIEDPNFVTMLPVIPPLVKYIPQTGSIATKVHQWIQLIGENPCVFPQYFVAFTAKLETADREAPGFSADLTNRVLSWCSESPAIDCYDTPKYICNWANLMLKYCGVDETLIHICYTISLIIPRFPAYVAFLDLFRRMHPDTDLASNLESSAKLRPLRVHVAAVHLASMNNFQTALELASFPSDTPETDALIESLDVK